jgi:hypothetical protein
MILLQIAIGATGNYGFFNILTIVLYLSLLDDATLARFGAGTASHPTRGPTPRASLRSGGELASTSSPPVSPC